MSNTGIFTILLISSLTIMVGTVIAPSLYQIAAQLGFSKSPGWLVTLPSLGVVLFAPVMGRLIDRKGAYNMMILGLIPYAIFGFGGAFLKYPSLVVIDRILLGGATAAIQASGTVLIAELFQGEKRMKMIAWQGMAID
ncbi:MFS transporter [Rhizosphaericola mali]|uniref:MFS transporter n=1 Tax=Rhizosphaericola mali TaxID=2545455 RepID=UPI00177D0193|nr:MFS transporter [Rhizosphaericola mali]